MVSGKKHPVTGLRAVGRDCVVDISDSMNTRTHLGLWTCGETCNNNAADFVAAPSVWVAFGVNPNQCFATG